MWVIWSWEDVVIAELKVSGGLLIAPEFHRNLSDQTNKQTKKKKKRNKKGKEYLKDPTSATGGSLKASNT